MKSYPLVFISFILIFFTVPSQAQQKVEWEFLDTTYSNYLAMYEAPDGELITTSQPRSKKVYIRNYTKDGFLIAENIYTNDSMNVEMHRIVWVPSKNYYVILGSGSYIRSSIERKRYFMTFIMDKYLNILSSNSYHQDVLGHLYNINYFVTANEAIFALAHVYSDGNNMDNKQLFFKIDNLGKVLTTQVDLGLECNSIIKNENGYQCIGENMKFFDEDFKLVSEAGPFFFISPYNSSKAIRLGSDKILVGTKQSSDLGLPPNLGTNKSVSMLYYVDNSMNIVKRNWIETDYPSLMLAGGVIDISPDSSIYIGNYHSPIFGAISFGLGKFDINLEKQWQIKFEAPGQYRYTLWGLEATNDNGVILYGGRWAWASSDLTSYIVKFNSEGNISWINNIDPKHLTTIKTFPNPSSGPLILDIKGITGKVDVRVYDMLGRNVYVQDGITEGETTIDLSGLTAGTYIYKIYQGSKEIGSGQWVKI